MSSSGEQGAPHALLRAVQPRGAPWRCSDPVTHTALPQNSLMPSELILAQLCPTPGAEEWDSSGTAVGQQRDSSGTAALTHPPGLVEWILGTAGAAEGKGSAAGGVNVSRQVPSEPGCFVHFLQNVWGYSLSYIKEWKIPLPSQAVTQK